MLVAFGKVYFVELKRPGGKPTPIQLRVGKNIERAGGDHRILDSLEQVKGLFYEIIDTARERGDVHLDHGILDSGL